MFCACFSGLFYINQTGIPLGASFLKQELPVPEIILDREVFV